MSTWKPRNIRSGSTTDNPGFPTPYPDLINRRIEFQFAGKKLQLDLSLGLFSSAGIDTGSMLLLKSLVQPCKRQPPNMVLDVGCGVGVLGIAIASHCPNARVTMIDRDFLAVSIASANAKLNRLQNVQSDHKLMLENPDSQRYSLIVCNFPAKAGMPVLSDFIKRSGWLLESDGMVAMVIVKNLARECGKLIADNSFVITHQESSKMHTVFHYRPTDSRPEISSDILENYVRNRSDFNLGNTTYKMETVWNISDFDHLSWRLELLGNMLEKIGIKGRSMFWAPGQGHLPALYARSAGKTSPRIGLADRDRLALLISCKNVLSNSPSAQVDLLPMLEAGELNDSGIDWLVTDMDPIPKSQWSGRILDAAARNVAKGAFWAVVGRSSDIATLKKKINGWTVLKDRRQFGWRAVILKKHR